MNNPLTAGQAVVHRKHFSVGRADKINYGPFHKAFKVIGNQHIQAVYGYRFFIAFRLIQSQPQLGAASTKSLDHDAQVFTGVFIKDFLNFVFGDISYRYHLYSFFFLFLSSTI